MHTYQKHNFIPAGSIIFLDHFKKFSHKKWLEAIPSKLNILYQASINDNSVSNNYICQILSLNN